MTTSAWIWLALANLSLLGLAISIAKSRGGFNKWIIGFGVLSASFGILLVNEVSPITGAKIVGVVLIFVSLIVLSPNNQLFETLTPQQNLKPKE